MSDTTPSPTSGDDIIAAASDGAYTLIVADFAATDTAWDAYEALKSVEDGKTVAIDGLPCWQPDGGPSSTKCWRGPQASLWPRRQNNNRSLRRTSACRRRLTAYASLQLPAAPEAESYA